MNHWFVDSPRQSFVDSLLHWIIRSLIYWFCDSLTHSFIHSFVRSFLHSFIHSFIHSSIHWLTDAMSHRIMVSLIHELTISLMSFIDSLLPWFVDSLVHWFIDPPIQWFNVHAFVDSLISCAWLLSCHLVGIMGRALSYSLQFTCKYSPPISHHCARHNLITFINHPAPGLPRVCFGIFLRVFMMTFMFISWYLRDFWSNHHHVWSENVANSIVFYFFIIFQLY